MRKVSTQFLGLHGNVPGQVSRALFLGLRAHVPGQGSGALLLGLRAHVPGQSRGENKLDLFCLLQQVVFVLRDVAAWVQALQLS